MKEQKTATQWGKKKPKVYIGTDYSYSTMTTTGMDEFYKKPKVYIGTGYSKSTSPSLSPSLIPSTTTTTGMDEVDKEQALQQKLYNFEKWIYRNINTILLFIIIVIALMMSLQLLQIQFTQNTISYYLERMAEMGVYIKK